MGRSIENLENAFEERNTRTPIMKSADSGRPKTHNLRKNWRPSSRIGMPLSRIFAHLQNSGGRKIVGFLAVGANLRDKAVVNGK